MVALNAEVTKTHMLKKMATLKHQAVCMWICYLDSDSDHEAFTPDINKHSRYLVSANTVIGCKYSN